MDRRRYKEKTIYSRLPDEYQEVEYLEGTGTQYIITNTLQDISNVFEIKFYANKLSEGDCIFGGYGPSSAALHMFRFYSTYYTFTCNSTQFIAPSVLGEHSALLSENECLFDGTEMTSRSDSGNYNRQYPISLFNAYASLYQPTKNRPFNGRVYFFRIYRGNSIELYIVPCYRKSDHKPGMYDLVNNVFYTNQGTGEFIVGKDIIPDCDAPGELGPDNPMKAKFVGYKKVKDLLPEEYQEVEYLQCNNGAYIDTNYFVNSNTIIICDAKALSNNGRIFGLFEIGTNVSNSFRLDIGGAYVYCFDTQWVIFNIPINERRVYEAGNRYLKVDGVFIFNYSKVEKKTMTRTLPIFTHIKGDGNVISKAEHSIIYSFIIKENENEIRNLVPCYRKADHEAGMYDIVNDVFYTNIGTGEFLVGPDRPNSIIVDRLWDYKRGIYNPETGEFTKL